MVSKNYSLFAVVAIVAAVTFLVFSETINYGYLNWDDDIYVQNNEQIRSLSMESIGWWFTNSFYYSYIPVTMISHSLDYMFWANSPGGHHLTNVLLHSLNAGLVALLGVMLFRLRERPGQTGDSPAMKNIVSVEVLLGMGLAALMFSLHPLRAESVAWISDRKDLLCAAFLLTATLLYLPTMNPPGSDGRRKYLTFTFLFFLLAVLSKSVAVGYPLILLLIDWLVLSEEEWKSGRKRLVKEKLPFIVAAGIVSLVLSLMIQSGGKLAFAVEALEGIEYFLFPFYGFFFYFFKTVLPFGLSPIYPSVDSVALLLGFATVIVISYLAFVAARQGRKEYMIAWLVYLVILVPTTVGLSTGMQPHADRFSYMATIGLFLLFGGGIIAVLRTRSRTIRLVSVGVLVVLLAGLSLLTLRQVSYWQSSESLWEYVVNDFPPRKDYLTAYMNLGQAYAGIWELPRAEEMYTLAVQLDSTETDALYGLGFVVYLQGEWERSADLFWKAHLVDSTNVKALYNFSVVSGQLGREDESVSAMRRAALLGSEKAREALIEAEIPLQEGPETSIPLERN